MVQASGKLDKKQVLNDNLDEEYRLFGFKKQMERDNELWYRTLTSNTLDPNEQHRIQILRRIFTVIRNGGLTYRTNSEDPNSWKWYHDSRLSVATALSHGSRILIQLPPENENKKGRKRRFFRNLINDIAQEYDYLDHDFWCWLITGDTEGDLSEVITTNTSSAYAMDKKKCVFRRLASTHGIKHLKNILRINLDGIERTKRIREVKKVGLSVRDTKLLGGKKRKINRHKHWGMNIALGGAGNQSFGISDGVISSDGCNGHVYLYYRAPKDNFCGGLLIGVEGSEFRSTSQCGEEHSITGKASRLSATFGYKWSKLKSLGCKGLEYGIPDKRDSLFIDLTNGWDYIIDSPWEDEYVREPATKFSILYNRHNKLC